MKLYNINIPKELSLDNVKETSVVVVSCSKFKDAWVPFFTLFKKYWKDCPYNVYFLTDIENSKPIKFDNVKYITTPIDYGWNKNFSTLLNEIKSKRIILFQEDFFIKKHVNTKQVRQLVNFSIENDIGCLRLCPSPGPSIPFNEFLGVIQKTDMYRFSMQLSIWDVDLIKRIVSSRDNIHSLETEGNIITSNEKKHFLSIWRESPEYPGGPIQYYITGIVKGFWQQGAIDLLNKEGISTSMIRKSKKI